MTFVAGGEFLEIHKPKAAHSLREFVTELLTIVAGIIIAICLEQAVEALHWRHQVTEGREALRRELQETDGFYTFRIAANDCVAHRLEELDGVLEQVAAHQRVEPVGDLTPHLGHLLADDIWQSQRSAQTLVHFPKGELAQYSAIYSQQVDIRAWLNREIEVWSAIRLLQGDPNRLSPSDITLIRNNIQIARVMNFLVVINGRTQLDKAAKLGAPTAAADPDEVRAVCTPLKRALPVIPYTTY